MSENEIVTEEATEENIQDFLKNSIEKNKTLLFMKGTADFPQCGFSARVIEILKNLDADFVTIDVLKNMHVREGIKQYSDWPTIPQLYHNQEFIGGCDIITEMYQSGELDEVLASTKSNATK